MELAKTMTRIEAAAVLGRSFKSVHCKGVRLGLSFVHPHSRYRWWQKEDVDTLNGLIWTIPIPEIARKLGRSHHSVDHKIRSLGLQDHRRTWTHIDDRRLIRLHSLGWSDKDIAIKMERCAPTIGRHRRLLGLEPRRITLRYRRKQSAAAKRYYRDQRKAEA